MLLLLFGSARPKSSLFLARAGPGSLLIQKTSGLEPGESFATEDLVEAAGVELLRSVENRKPIESLGAHKTQNHQDWANR